MPTVSSAKMMAVTMVPMFSARPGSLASPERPTNTIPISEAMMPAAHSTSG